MEIVPATPVPHAWSGLRPGLLYEALSLASYRVCARKILQICVEMNVVPEVVWTAGGDGGSLASAFGDLNSVFQAVDSYSSYQGNGVRRLLIRDVESASTVVAIGVGAAESLRRECDIRSLPVHVLGQGVDLSEYAQGSPSLQLKGLPHPLAIWIGPCWKLDRFLIERAARLLEDFDGSLVLVGQGCPEYVSADPYLRCSRAVSALPAVPHDEISSLLMAADIGLMLYDQSADQRRYLAQNPLKLYEYAASGLSIVSTWHYEYFFLEAPVRIVDSGTIDYVLTETLDEIRMGNKASARVERAIQFSSAHSWDAVVDSAERVLIDLAT